MCVCVYRVFMVRPEGKKPLERTRRTWEDNIKIGLKEVGWGGMACIVLAQYRCTWGANVNAVLKLRVPQNAGNFLNSWETVSFLERALLHGVPTCIHTCYTYNGPFCMHANVCTYTHVYLKPLQSLCSWSDYRPDDSDWRTNLTALYWHKYLRLWTPPRCLFELLNGNSTSPSHAACLLRIGCNGC